MENLVTFLEDAVQKLSMKTTGPSMVDQSSKWTKNVLFAQFKTEADNHREKLKVTALPTSFISVFIFIFIFFLGAAGVLMEF